MHLAKRKLERLKEHCKKGGYCVKRLRKPGGKERREGKTGNHFARARKTKHEMPRQERHRGIRRRKQ